MGLVDNLLTRKAAVEAECAPWRDHVRDLAKYVLPTMAQRETTDIVRAIAGEPNSAYVSPQLYDHTAVMAIQRLAAGEISLNMPSSSIWHDLKKSDPFAPDPNQEEKEFFERLRNYLFKMRYNPKTGFVVASKAAIKSRCAFGTGIIYISEQMGQGAGVPVSYRYVPLLENNLGANFEGVVDTNFRAFTRTASQCVEKWGDQCSAKVKTDANDPDKSNRVVQLVHAVLPRREFSDESEMDYSSFYLEVEERHLIRENGYFEFPYIVLHWDRETQGPYSEGPVSMAISEIKSLQLMSKEEYTAAQQWINPPTAQKDDDHNRPDLSPGGTNPGMLNERGELLVKPIMLQANPGFARDIIQAKQQNLKEALYVNLWQILIASPNMTATEAMIRAQEKGDLLGPSGLSLQVGLANMVDREIGILGRKGAFESGSRLEVPGSMNNQPIGVGFTGPLDRMRRIPQLQGIERAIEMAGRLAEVGNNSGIERLDGDRIMEHTQDIGGAPADIFKSELQVTIDREERRQMDEQQETLQGIEQGGAVAQAVGRGVMALQDAGAVPDAEMMHKLSDTQDNAG
ncbi:MAG: hypothetical protein GY742_11245 [Hyphomicrobiales bacterium]|nr:hypothetical protein [Hyphomicrobiales bacterium]